MTQTNIHSLFRQRMTTFLPTFPEISGSYKLYEVPGTTSTRYFSTSPSPKVSENETDHVGRFAAAIVFTGFAAGIATLAKPFFEAREQPILAHTLDIEHDATGTVKRSDDFKKKH
jgi:hypothetical protein